MVKEELVNNFQQAHGLFLPFLISDHCPMIVKVPNGIQKRKSSFRFYNFITEKENFLPTEYQQATEEEYSLLCQKAKVEWLKDGDRNIAYFHKTIKERTHRGRIMSIRNEEGIRFVNEDVFSRENDKFVSDAEIKNAMFDIEDSKAPGLDVHGSLVGENQSAFIEGRQITDNILLSQELFKRYNRKQKTKKVSFKIDLEKAYDTISWDFLKEILEMFGFHKTMVNWIMTCITSTKFSINMNGERVGYFKGGRGLRQGDPISPYIFTLVMEVLNLLIQKNIEESKGFKYHFGCKNLKITHLCFADDLLVFCRGDVVSVKVMKKSLDEFSGFSGLLPNMQKSTIFFGGLSNAEQQCIINIIPFTVGTLLASVFLLPKQDYIDSRDIYDARLNNNCTINGIINEGRWNWHEEWKSDFVELNQIQVPNLNEDVEDTAVWVCENGNEKSFKISNIWKDLKCNGEKNMLNIRFSDRWNLIISEMIALPLNRNIWSIVRRIVLKLQCTSLAREESKMFNNEKGTKKQSLDLIK
ncbi:RNA-directed DNA polymerase, eukaryota, reverse transcriptase zinc-binding domain protein [Tanacetum coccineum]